MPSSAALRLQIERSLEHRFPSVLTPAARTIRDVAATGISELDALISGGLPVGAISELTGPSTSGRTSIAMSFVARRTEDAQVCAWVDVKDSFDPESAAATGVRLSNLLWVRCSEEAAVNHQGSRYRRNEKLWVRLDQALRATDLLLQAGGFSAIVLDLGDEAMEYASRIPLATWFRYRQAADRTRCSLVVLGKTAYAQSSAAVVVECRASGALTSGGMVLHGFDYTVQARRERLAPFSNSKRKPPASTWSAQSAWKPDRRA